MKSGDLITRHPFKGDRVIAAILFERTLDGEAKGKRSRPTWGRNAASFRSSRSTKGSTREKDGVSLIKPRPGLDPLLARASKLGVLGTKYAWSSTWRRRPGSPVVRQQFEFGERSPATDYTNSRAGDLNQKPDKAAAERILLNESTKGLDALPAGRKVIFKVTLPDPRLLRAVDQG